MDKRIVAKAWSVLASRVTYRDQWISVRTDDAVDGRGELVRNYHVLEYPDWVNVAPVLDDGRLLLAREYRHGVGAIVLGLIGGEVAEVDGALAEAAARRELLEETGYSAASLTPILTCYPNAATHTNRVLSFVAQGLESQRAPSFEIGEEVELAAAAPGDLLAAVQAGRIIMQAPHLAALYAGFYGGLFTSAHSHNAVIERGRLWPDALEGV